MLQRRGLRIKLLDLVLGEITDPQILRRLSPTLLQKWRKQLLGSAEEVFGRKSKETSTNRAEERLRIENDRMKSVIAEITAENLDLKKTLSD